MANILYIGHSNPASTSAHRAYALRRLGHAVTIANPYEAVLANKGAVLNFLHYRTGYRWLQSKVNSWLTTVLANNKYDLVWVDSGELLGRDAVQLIRQAGLPVVLYNIDDPTGKRDKGRFGSLLKALPLYTLVVVVRKETEAECLNLGAKAVMRVLRSYDEEAHKPYSSIDQIPASYRSEVAFIGTWMRHEKRDEFLIALIRQGVPVSIWGDRWKKSSHWAELAPAYRGGALGGRDYVAAMQGAKLCLGFLSKGNRDLHTTRSLEIPYAGGLLCAERTAEHLNMYSEGSEAVFWATAEECASVCKALLRDDALRENIRRAGMQKVRSLAVGNEDICRNILSKLNINEKEPENRRNRSSLSIGHI